MNNPRVFTYGYIIKTDWGTEYGSGVSTTNCTTLEDALNLEATIRKTTAEEQNAKTENVVLTFISEITYEA